MHIVWTERAIDERLRDKFFPAERQSHALNYAIIRNRKVALRRTLVLAEEGKSNAIPSLGRLQITPDGRLFVVYYISGSDGAGKALSDNLIMELRPDGSIGDPVALPLQHPLSSYFTATVRGGSPPSTTLDLLGLRAGSATNICYARVRLW